MRDNTNQSIDRETLYNEVWTEPVTVVAPRYGLSDVGLAKICRSLRIPLPSRGYWAKVKAGKVMGRAPLPKLTTPGHNSTGLQKLPPEQAAVREAVRKDLAKIRKEVAAEVPAPEEQSPPHTLVKAASKRLRQRDDWPKETHLRSAPTEVLNLVVTRATLDRALLITDSLLKALAPLGASMRIDEKRSATLLEFVSPPVTVEFSLTEQVKRSRHEITPAEKRAQDRYYDRWRAGSGEDNSYPSIPQYDYHPTGILIIQVGRWPARTWRDTPRTPLERRLKEVVAGILGLAQEIHASAIEKARRDELHRQAMERYEFLANRRTDEAKRFQELEVQAKDWERAMRLRSYADAVEKQALIEGGVSTGTREMLDWVRAKADWLDPLIPVSDAILDAPEPKRPYYLG